jgi:CheY-like chemotaxis protein
LKAPETPAEFWDAVKFSLNVGRADEAAKYLDRLLANDPPIELLLQIRERDAATMFPKLAAAPELNEKGLVLVRKIEEAATARARDPQRIQQFIEYLTRSPQHRAYGVTQLRSAGPDAVPYLLAALADPARADHQSTILLSMEKLDTSALPPLVAALQTDNGSVLPAVVHLLGVLGDRDVVPHLRFVAESPDYPEVVQTAARVAVERILDRQYADLPAAADALTAQANRYYEHQVRLRTTAAGAVRLWRWIPREGLKAEEVSPSYAEEYFGLGHCRQALALDPNHEPAKIALVSVAIEKAYEKIGVDQPLGEGPGTIAAESLAAGAELLGKVLVRALDEGRSSVAVGALRALAHTAHPNLLAPLPGRASPLILALTAPDRRVQFAAAEAVLSLRPDKPFPGSSQVVTVLARELVGNGAARAMVIDPNSVRAGALSSLLREAGYEAQALPNSAEAFPIIADSADFELIAIDPDIFDPNLSPTLAAFRADPRTAGVPIAVVGDAGMQLQLAKLERRYARVKFIERPASLDLLKLQLKTLRGVVSKPLTASERAEHARRSAMWIARIARGEVRGLDLRPAESALLKVLGDETLGADVIVAAGALPSVQLQAAMAQLILNESTLPAIRVESARQMTASVRRFGLLLDTDQTSAVQGLVDTAEDPTLHQALAALAGAMKPRAGDIAARLLQYRTPAFDPAAVRPADPVETAPAEPPADQKPAAGAAPAADAPAAPPTAQPANP